MAIIKGSLATTPQKAQPQTEVGRFVNVDPPVLVFDETEKLSADVTNLPRPGAVIITNRRGYRKNGTRGPKPSNVGVNVVAALLTEVPLAELDKYIAGLQKISEEAKEAGLV